MTYEQNLEEKAEAIRQMLSGKVPNMATCTEVAAKVLEWMAEACLQGWAEGATSGDRSRQSIEEFIIDIGYKKQL